MIRYQAKLVKDGKGYFVEFPDLPGCLSQGFDKEEALENAQEALSLYLEEARDPAWEVPKARTRKGRNYHWVSPYTDVGIALLIRQARRSKGMSQRQLAKAVGMTVQQLQKLETPGKSNPTVKTLALISEALDEKFDIKLVA